MLHSINHLHPVNLSRWAVHAQVGKRLPTLKALIENPYTPWQTVVVKDWYGHGDYTLQIASHTAVWYHTGLPVLPIRWVLIKDPKGKARTSSPSMYKFIGSTDANFAMVPAALASGGDF